MKVVFAAVLVSLFASCTQNNEKPVVASPAKRDAVVQNSDLSRIAVIPYNYDCRLSKRGKPASITQEEFLEIDRLLKLAIQEWNSEVKSVWVISNLDKYWKQYVAVVNNKGEKEVWISCSCSQPTEWRKEIYLVEDGVNAISI